MRHACLAVFLLSSFCAVQVLAEEAATPKATISKWTEAGAGWTLDQAMQIYHAQGEKEATFAKAMAEQALASAQLQKAVRDKWGKDAETAVSRAMQTDTLDDDQASTEKVDGDHATITFKPETQLPTLYMVKVDGQWKVDAAAIMRDVGEKAEVIRQYMHQSAVIEQNVLHDLTAGKYKDSTELTGYVDKELTKISPP